MSAARRSGGHPLSPSKGLAEVGVRRLLSLARPALLLVAGAALLTGCSAGSEPGGASSAAPGIGAWPTFLPSPAPQGEPTGSLESPAMSYPGSPVVVSVGTAHALVAVDGPSYPADTKVGAEEVRCTFTVRVSQVSAPISLKGASFDVLDSRGGLHALSAAPHRVPDRLEPGRDATLTLVGTLPAGEGLLRFYPTTDGAVAAWDFVAETD